MTFYFIVSPTCMEVYLQGIVFNQTVNSLLVYFYHLDLESTVTEKLDNSPDCQNLHDTSVKQKGRNAGTSKLKKIKRKVQNLLLL